VAENEPEVFAHARQVLLTKDHVCYRLTREDAMDKADGAAFSAALLAGVGAGAWRDVPAACKESVRITGSNLPDTTKVESSRKAYPIYRGLYPALRPAFEKTAG